MIKKKVSVMALRFYFMPETLLPFKDLAGKKVAFKLSGRPKHGSMDGVGTFDIIPSGKTGHLRIEIIVKPPDGSYIRIPLSRMMVKAIKNDSPEKGVDFSLFYHYRPRRTN